MSLQEALRHPAPSTITSIEAPSGDISETGQFPNLTSLSLAGNHDTRNFAFLRTLPKLKELFLTDTGITEIPPEVANLPELATLFIGENAISDFSILPELRKLTDLSLAKMGLRKVPEAVTRIHRLRVLGIAHNSITSLSSLKPLKALTTLYAGSNRLKKIAKGLAKLPLRELHIVGNYELKDYATLENLPDLEVLSIGNSGEVANIPACVFDLTKLRELTIASSYNPESVIIEGIENLANLSNLRVLNIEQCSLTRLPDGIRKLRHLRTLNLRNSQSLVSVDALHDLPELANLDLTKCDISELGDGFSTLKALRTLKLSHNKNLENISGLRDLPQLESLEFYSKRPTLPASLGTLTALTTLKLSASANDVSFLASLVNLEELYIAGCQFDALPKELTKLRTLTVSRKDGENDSYLANYPNLEELHVSQPSFTIPTMPKLKTLGIGRIEKELDLSAIGSCVELQQLSVHRSDNLTDLPEELSLAKSVKRASFEFLENLTGITAVAGLPKLEELTLRFLDSLENLPSDLAGHALLRSLTLNHLAQVEDISVVGEFLALERLELVYLGSLQSIPAKVGELPQLSAVEIEDCDDLEDISALEKAPALKHFSVDSCGKLRRKPIAAVESAIASRTDQSVELRTSYQHFMDSGMYKSLTGKEDAKRPHSFPLSFAPSDILLEAAKDYSWVEDILEDDGEDGNSILRDADNDLKILATLDFGWEGCDADAIDSYSEEIFLVDTASPRNPVFIWGHDSSPTKLHEDFDAFLGSLRDFVSDQDDNAEDDANGQRTYLTYVDEKSSKFWQITVAGSDHEVTYGKIGKARTAKVKSFDSPQSAQKSAEKLIAAKRKKGYKEDS